jgi:hypothetical protein
MIGKAYCRYVVAGIAVDPCEIVRGLIGIGAAWEGNPQATADEALKTMAGIELHCPCGNVQAACLRDASALSDVLEDFNRQLKPGHPQAGPKRLTQYQKRKLRELLREAFRRAAAAEANRQVCTKCGAVYSLSR